MKPEHRICSTCKEARPPEHFAKKRAKCRLCQRDYDSEKRRVSSQFVWDFLCQSSGCVSCNERNPIKLAFHHLDQATKSAVVSDLARNGYPIKRIKEEMDKCVVICHNCHSIESAKQLGYYRNLDTKGWL